MTRPLNILFLGGAKRVSMARMLIDAGLRAGYAVKIFSYELEHHVPIASTAEIIIGRRWNAPDILEHIHHTIEQHSISIIIPFVDGAVGIAARYRDRYGNIYAPVGETSRVEAMFDKIAADNLFRQTGIPIPEAYTKGRPVFPLIAKPRFGSASQGIRIIDNPRDFRDVTNNADRYLIQQYIARREEYTVDCFITADFRIICTVPRRRLEIIGGEVSRTITVLRPDIMELSRSVINRLHLSGAITLQFIADLDTGHLMLMEINPRLGGGAVCAVHAGADIPAYIIAEATGASLPPCSDWRAGTEITRYQQEVVFHNDTPQ